MFPWLAAASFVGGLLGSSAQRRAEERARKEQLAWLQEYYGPNIRVRKMLEGKLGKESPLLAAQHQLALQDINQTEAAQLTGSEGYWRRAGNEGRARGEKWRLRQEATRARAGEAIDYGQSQQSYKDRVMQLILGSAGPEGAAIGEVIRDKGRIQSSFYGSVVSGFGNLMGEIETQKRWGDVMGKLDAGYSRKSSTKTKAATAKKAPVASQTQPSKPAINDTPLLDLPQLDVETSENSPWNRRRPLATSSYKGSRRGPRAWPARM